MGNITRFQNLSWAPLRSSMAISPDSFKRESEYPSFTYAVSLARQMGADAIYYGTPYLDRRSAGANGRDLGRRGRFLIFNPGPPDQKPVAVYSVRRNHTTEEEVLQTAAGHLEGSSLPVGGENTHAVISAHRGLPSAKLFSDIDQLEKGDRFYLHILHPPPSRGKWKA